MHGLTPGEVTEILALADQWGHFDVSHRKLAHRGSYEQRVWVSPSTVLRVLLAYGRALPHRPAREPVAAREWPAWVSYRPNQVWGYDLTALPAARTAALAIVGPHLTQVDRLAPVPRGDLAASPGPVHPRAGRRRRALCAWSVGTPGRPRWVAIACSAMNSLVESEVIWGPLSLTASRTG